MYNSKMFLETKYYQIRAAMLKSQQKAKELTRSQAASTSGGITGKLFSLFGRKQAEEKPSSPQQQIEDFVVGPSQEEEEQKMEESEQEPESRMDDFPEITPPKEEDDSHMESLLTADP